MAKVYIAGPMSNLPQFNYPAFHAAAKALREAGHEVISPAEMDTPEQQAVAMASPDGNLANFESSTKTTWGDILAKDVKIVADVVDVVMTLPNWHKSRGARLEVQVANLCKKNVYEYDPDTNKSKLMDAMEMNLGILGFPIKAKMTVEV